MFYLPFFNYLFITGGSKMSVEVNSKKLDEIKQVIVDAVTEKLAENENVDRNQLQGNVNITGAILKGNDHISIDCNIVLAKEAINNYDNNKEPKEVDNKPKQGHKTHKTDK